VLDDGEHNATLERSGIEGSRGSVLMKTDMRSYDPAHVAFLHILRGVTDSVKISRK
jgi:hypothetical protein